MKQFLKGEARRRMFMSLAVKWILGIGATLLVLFLAGVLSTDEQDRGKPGGCLFQVARGALVIFILGVGAGVIFYFVSILLAIYWWIASR